MNKKKTLCSGELKGCTGEYTTAQARCMLKEPQKKKKKGTNITTNETSDRSFNKMQR